MSFLGLMGFGSAGHEQQPDKISDQRINRPTARAVRAVLFLAFLSIDAEGLLVYDANNKGRLIRHRKVVDEWGNIEGGCYESQADSDRHPQ
jgi:hypothetical protein